MLCRAQSNSFAVAARVLLQELGDTAIQFCYSTVCRAHQVHDGWLVMVDTISWDGCHVTTPGHSNRRGILVPGPEPYKEGDGMAPGTHTSFGDVVGIPHDVSCQTKVTDLHQLSLADEDIPGSQVTMHTLQGGRALSLGATSNGTEKKPSSSTSPFLLLQGQESSPSPLWTYVAQSH